jgi:hypothetical protein
MRVMSLIALMLEAARASEMLANYQATWCYNPEDSHLQDYLGLEE